MRHSTLVLASFVLFAANVRAGLGLPPSADQQQQPPVRSTGTEVVEVQAIEVQAFVTDSKGAVVRGLRREDFQLLEDGKPQQLSNVSFVDMPTPNVAANVASAQLPSDVSSNAQVEHGRLYAIVLDGLHTAPMRSTVVRKLARQFVEGSMGADDVAAVVHLGQAHLSQSFTSNKALLIASIERFIGSKVQGATASMAQSALMRTQNGPEDTDIAARANDSRLAMVSLAELCRSLGTVAGSRRRAVVVFGEGVEFDTSDLIGPDQRPAAVGSGQSRGASQYAGDLLLAQRDLLEAARKANVAFYTVDPRGNSAGEDVNMQLGSTVSGTSILREVGRGQGSLRSLASETGGLAIVGTNSIAKEFTQIVQANSSFYVLAYTPAARHDGAYHRISVTVKSPGATVAARQGYFSAKASSGSIPVRTVPTTAKGIDAASAGMRDLLASELPMAGMGIRLSGGPIGMRDKQVIVAMVIEIDTKDLQFAESDGFLSNDVEMGFLAIGADRKIHAGNRTVGNLKLPVAERSTLSKGLRYVVEFPVPPGRYQLRAAARESLYGIGGSAVLDVDAGTTITGGSPVVGPLFLTTASANDVPTTGGWPVLRRVFPTPPTTAREFSSSETVTVMAWVVDPSKDTTNRAVSTTLQSEAGREVFRQVTPRSSNPAVGGYQYVVNVPLTGLPPGRYVLTVIGSGNKASALARSVTLSVR